MIPPKKEQTKTPDTVIPSVEDECDVCVETEESSCPKSDIPEEDASC